MLLVPIYGRVCRVCLEKTSKLINLNETIREYSLTMLELLHQSVPGSLKVEMDFPLPDEICENCRNHLIIAYKLQQMYMDTNQKLYRIWQESQKNIESTIHPENAKDKKEQDIEQIEVQVCFNEMDPIDLELSADEEQLAYGRKEPLLQQIDQNHKEDMTENELKTDDDDADADDDDKPLICLRNKSILKKHEIKVKKIVTQTDGSQERTNSKETSMSSGNHCGNCNKTFKHLSKHQCKRITKALHACTTCPKRFSSTTLMQKHMRNKHKHDVLEPLTSGVRKLKSPKDMEFLTESSQCYQSLQGQFEGDLGSSFDHHDEDSVCREESCNISLKTDPSMPTSKTMEILKNFSCNECNASFRFQKQLERHRKKHTDAYRFVCLACSDRFKYPFMLQKHVEKHHPAQSNKPKVREIKSDSQEKSHACNYCSAAYTNVGGLAQHMSKKHPEIVPFKCDKCDKTFVVEEHLKIHTNRHMGIKNFKCDLCDKSFSFKFAMKQHMRIHTGDLNYLCTLCGKKFYRPSNLRQHMQRHGDDKPYTCPHCPKRFKCPSDRYIHLMSHQEGKNHVCSTCGSRFSRVDTLHQHQILHTGEKPYKCDQCPMAFPRLMNLNRHLRTHTGEKPYKCKYCDKAYAQSNDLNKHLRTHVGENTYMCTQCPSAFKYQAELKSHEWEHYRKQKQDE